MTYKLFFYTNGLLSLGLSTYVVVVTTTLSLRKYHSHAAVGSGLLIWNGGKDLPHAFATVHVSSLRCC